jgi:hypothetical protein
MGGMGGMGGMGKTKKEFGNNPRTFVPNLKKRKPSTKLDSKTLKRIKHRIIFKFPSNLIDPNLTPRKVDLPSDIVPLWDNIIVNAEKKLLDVQSGKTAFGTPVVIPSMVIPSGKTDYTVPATLSAMFILNGIFSDQVLDTASGKVGVYFLTVYTSEKQKKSKVGGYPVVCLHRAQFKPMLSAMHSATKNFMTSNLFSDNFSHAECTFDGKDDGPLVTLSGLEPYDNTKQKKNGFFLLPAHWLDVVKYHVVNSQLQLRLLPQVFQRTFPDIAERFLEKYSCLFLGDRRKVNTQAMIGKNGGGGKHRISMTRCRAGNNEIRIGRNGLVWSLPENSSKGSKATYNHDSIIFGSGVWRSLLLRFNTVHTFFTGQAIPDGLVFHMRGITALNPDCKVSDRKTCIANGLQVEKDPVKLSSSTRKRRYQLKKLNPDYIHHFGPEAVREYKKRTGLCRSTK